MPDEAVLLPIASYPHRNNFRGPARSTQGSLHRIEDGQMLSHSVSIETGAIVVPQPNVWYFAPITRAF
jgi:hypothetical protein